MNNEEREIDLKILFSNVFIKWRKIILITVVCGILAVGYRAVKVIPTYSTLQATYEHDVAEYQTSVNFSNKQISDTENEIQKLNEYSENSIKANINPYSEAQSVVTIYITANDSTDASKQITQAYQTFISSGVNYGSVASTLGKTDQLVNELVTAKSNLDANSVAVTVIGQTTEQTETIITDIVSQVKNEEISMQAKYGQFSIIVGEPATQIITDSSMLSSTYQTTDQMLSVNVTMNGVTNKVTALKTALKSLNASKPVAPTSPFTTVAKSLLNYLSFGLAFGFLIYVIIAVLTIVNRKTISSEDELKKQFELKILTVISRKNLLKKTKFDRKLSKVLDSANGVDDKTALEKAVINIAAYAGDKKSLLVISDDKNQDIEKLITDIKSMTPSINYVISKDLNKSADELTKLKNTDGVIIVAERNVTKFDSITKTIETIKNWKKPIVGSIVL